MPTMQGVPNHGGRSVVPVPRGRLPRGSDPRGRQRVPAPRGRRPRVPTSARDAFSKEAEIEGHSDPDVGAPNPKVHVYPGVAPSPAVATANVASEESADRRSSTSGTRNRN